MLSLYGKEGYKVIGSTRELVPGIKRGHCPASVMVLWDCVTSLHFCEKVLKQRRGNISRKFSKCSAAPNSNYVQNIPWIFQQDSAPAHKTKTMQQWLENHVPEFISSDH